MVKSNRLIAPLLLVSLTLAVLFPDIVGKIHRKIGGERYVNEFEFYQSSLWQFYKNRTKTLKDSTIIFFGDSRINGVSVESHFDAVNYGISGETLQTAVKEIPKFPNLGGRTIVLGYGINDNFREPLDIYNDFLYLLGELKESKVLILEVLPTDGKVDFENSKVHELNKLLSTLPNYVPLKGQQKNGVLIHTYDGVHLDERGNGIFLSELDDLLK